MCDLFVCVCVCVFLNVAGLLRDKSNLEAVKNEALDSQASIEEKSRHFIEQQQQKIKELVQQKVWCVCVCVSLGRRRGTLVCLLGSLPGQNGQTYAS